MPASTSHRYTYTVADKKTFAVVLSFSSIHKTCPNNNELLKKGLNNSM